MTNCYIQLLVDLVNHITNKIVKYGTVGKVVASVIRGQQFE